MANVNSGIVAAAIFEDRADIIFSNDRYYEMLGYTREQYEEAFRGAVGPVSPKDIGWVLPKVQEAVRTGEPMVLEYRSIRRDGAEIWVQQRTANTDKITGAVSQSGLG